MLRAFMLLLLPSIATAQTCTATPEIAARSAIGSVPVGNTGDFRASGVQIDPVMKRVWVRVVRCSDVSAPAVLVPVAAPLVTSETIPQYSTATPSSHPLLRAGQTVQAIYRTATAQMTLEAVADQSAAVGETISLTLKRRAGQSVDEPEHRIRGMLRADGIVEVQP